MIDVLIDGPFMQGQPTDLVWRGSANQGMNLLSDKAKKEYSQWVNYRVEQRELQAVPVQEGLMVIGIPRAGDWKWK